MDELIKLLNSHYVLDEYSVKEDVLVLYISSIDNEINCPYCGTPAHRVHSWYAREIQDLPVMDKKTILLVKTRKMICENPLCDKKTFSERHPFVNIKGKKTLRLEKNIIYASTQVSSINASQQLKLNKVSVSKSSICALLKKNAISCG